MHETELLHETEMLHETELLHETKLLHETESHWADIAGWTSNKEIGSKAESKLRARVVPGVNKKQNLQRDTMSCLREHQPIETESGFFVPK